MDLIVTSEALDAMLKHAAAEHPMECCGLLFGSGGRIARTEPTANVHPDRATHFEIDPRALIDAHRKARRGGPTVAGHYHSHPNGLAKPSATDRENASGDGSVWAIIACGTVSFWRDDPEGFSPLSHATTSA